MDLGNKKRIIASILKCGEKRVWLDSTRLSDIKEAITKEDLRALISEGAVKTKIKGGISRGRARVKHAQLKKGRGGGRGTRKGKRTSRLPRKREWINKIRLQRGFLRELHQKKLISPLTNRLLKRKVKGGFFRSRRHIKLYLLENNLFVKK